MLEVDGQETRLWETPEDDLVYLAVIDHYDRQLLCTKTFAIGIITIFFRVSFL